MYFYQWVFAIPNKRFLKRLLGQMVNAHVILLDNVKFYSNFLHFHKQRIRVLISPTVLPKGYCVKIGIFANLTEAEFLLLGVNGVE